MLRGNTLGALTRTIFNRAAEQRRHLAHLNAYPGAYDLGTKALAYSDALGRYRQPSDVVLVYVGACEDAIKLLDEHGFTRDGARVALARVELLLLPYEARNPDGSTYLAQPSSPAYFERMRDTLRTILDESDRALPMTVLGTPIELTIEMER